MTRVLVDTNVVISALLFPSPTPAQALALVLDEHHLVLTDWILAELREVIGRKRADLLPALEAFLAGVDFELAEPGQPGVPISDPHDQPILDAAIAAAVDLVVTGDKAVLSLGLERPRIMTARGFVDEYARNVDRFWSSSGAYRPTPTAHTLAPTRTAVPHLCQSPAAQELHTASDAMKGRGLRSSCVPGGCWGCTHVDDEGGPSCQSTQGSSSSVSICIAAAA